MRLVVGSPRFVVWRGPRSRLVMARGVEPAGVQGRGVGTRGFARNLGDPRVSASTPIGVGLPTPKFRAAWPASGRDGETKTGARCGTVFAKATKRSGTGVRESEFLIVPGKPGNARRAEPVEGRGNRDTDPEEGSAPGHRTRSARSHNSSG